MKTICIILLGFFMPLCCSSPIFGQEAGRSSQTTLKGSMQVVSTPALFDVASKWATEFGRLNPELNINVIKYEGRKSSRLVSSGVDLAFVSGVNPPADLGDNSWNQVVGRDVIVPIMNSRNSFLKTLEERGVTSEQLSKTLTEGSASTWETLIGEGGLVPLKIYIVDNEFVRNGTSEFLGLEQGRINGKTVADAGDLIAAVEQDPNAIGFCRLTDILDPIGQNIDANIHIIPIDKNQNGKMDYAEQIYSDYQSFARGVWIGKYPRSLYHNIYTISSKPPVQESTVGFVKWITNGGQEYLNASGYTDLVMSERFTKIDALIASELKVDMADTFNTGQKILAILIGAFLALAVVGNGIVWLLNHRKSFVPVSRSKIRSIFDENSVRILNGLYFDKTHTWAFMETNGLVKIGIDDFIQHVTGSITNIKMKNVGEKVKKGDKMISIIQDGKQLNIYSPISGIVEEQNGDLATDSSVLNSSPYLHGWVYRVQPTNWVREIQFFLMADSYREWLKNEFTRLKDFLSVALKSKSVEPARIVLQDGGALKDCMLEDFGPEIWEDFQSNFIDINQ